MANSPFRHAWPFRGRTRNRSARKWPSDRPRYGLERLEPRTLLADGMVISEFMASNGGSLLDEDGDSSDWIEVFNGAPTAVDLNGWYLTDSAADLTQWQLPDVTLEAGGYLVVFASGKDRREPGGELHTNFSLDADREFLALVEPDGTTIAHQYDPEYPAQRSDISYGLPQEAQSVIGEGATWRYLVPSSGTLGQSWTGLSFNDGGWSSGVSSFGYGVQGLGFSVERASASSSFGQVNTLARADAILDAPPGHASVAYAATGITPVVNFFDTGGDGNFGNNLPFPGDRAGDDNQYAVRATGTIFIPQSGVYTFGTSSDDGVRLRIDGIGRIIDDTDHAPEDRIAAVSLSAGEHEIEVTFFEVGGGSELELFAARGSHSAFNDLFRLVGDVAGGGLAVFTNAAGSVATDVGGQLAELNSSLYLRRDFNVVNAADLTSMTLDVRYSDGFVAYLNGVEVARRGVAGAVAWNSAAAADRTLEETLAVQRIPLGQFIPLLAEGTNVLAVQALKSGAADATLFIEPALTIAGDALPDPVHFTDPTPGEPNGAGILGWPAAPTVSVAHGFYDSPQTVTLQTDTPGATIRYTTGGDSPLLGGTVYTGPITIDRTTTLRAAATLDDHLPSDVTTQTYVFLSDVIRQSTSTAVQQGFPSSSINGQSLRYGMNQTVVNSVHGEEAMIDSLASLPAISLVTDAENLFDPQSGIYVNANSRGPDWERPVSVELLNIDDMEGFQIDAGMRIRGGFSRSGGNPKHAFRLFFRGEYDGPSEYAWFGDEGADTFYNMDLRTSQNYSWSFQNSSENTFEREVFSRDVQRDMGYEYTRSRYYHLYVNGQYWGIFQTQERSEADFAATYYGGEASDYDVIKATGNAAGYTIEVTDGSMQAWSDLWDMAVDLAQSPSNNMDNYWTMQGLNPDGTRNPALPVLLDVDALIDYMLITFYAGNTDTPLSSFLRNNRPNNWFGIYNRETADRGFQFFQHDGEHTLATSGSEREGAPSDRTGPYLSGNRFTLAYSNPQFLHQHLMAHPEYVLRVADRANLHLANGGALTHEASLARFNARVAEVEAAIPAEQARWGSTSLGVPQYEAQLNEVRTHLQTRSQIVLDQLADDGLYSFDAPRFNQHGGTIRAAFSLVMFNPTGQGTVYYTLDGTDPRLIGGGVNPAALIFTGATQTTQLIAAGSQWRYLDNGSNQGTTWRQVGFNDASWQTGAAQLGYGNNGEVTTIGFGGDANNKHITTYFRRTFDVSDIDSIAELTLRILRDDGAIAYINGQEVVRTNMGGEPGRPGGYTQRAAATVGGAEETTFFEFAIPPGVLVEGQNTIAVEVHQVVPNSSDLGFDLELTATAVSGGVALPDSARVTSRVRQGTAWSPLTQALFVTEAVTAAGDNLRISEINFNPYDPLAQFGDLSTDNDEFEFIELINVSRTDSVSLAGVTFTEGIEFDFTNASITMLAPGERLLVVRNAVAFASRYGVGLPVAGEFAAGALANDGEGIKLRDALGEVIQSFSYGDSEAWPDRADGDGSSLEVIDFAGDYDDPSNWRASIAFGGSPGRADDPHDGVVINEVLAHTDLPLTDTVELFNTLDVPVNIGGWWLSDSSANLLKYRIPNGALIAEGGYAVFTEQHFGLGSNGFSLSSAGEEVWLIVADASGKPLRFGDGVAFDATLTDVSLGRLPDGNLQGDLFPLASRSLGSANGEHLPGEALLSEVHYHPSDPSPGAAITARQLEFVEIYNRSAFPLDVAGWKLDGGIEMTFPAGAEVPGGGTLVAVSFDPNDAALASGFRSVHGIGSNVALIGPYGGQLAGGGETVRLLAPTDPPEGQTEPVYYLVDRVAYDDAPPWPTTPDGGGASLTRRSPTNYGDDAASWTAAPPSPGSTNFSVTVLAGDYNGNGRVEQADLDLVLLNWGMPAAAVPTGWTNDLPRGLIDQEELDAVLLNWGASLAAARIAPAEPTALTGKSAAAKDEAPAPAMYRSAVPLSGSMPKVASAGKLKRDIVREALRDDAVSSLFGFAAFWVSL